MADVRNNFSIVRHEAISQNQGEAEHIEVRRSASVFYNSCLAFAGKSADLKATTEELFKCVTVVFQALNISVTEWLKMTDPTQLFDHIVHLSLVNRFHVIMDVSIIHSGEQRTLQVNRIPALHNLVREVYHASLAKYLGQVVKAIGKDGATGAVVNEVVALDKKRAGKLPEGGDAQLSLNEIQCKSFPGKTWRDAIEKDVSLPENITVSATVAGSVCDDLNAVLVDTKTAARPLYILAQVSAHVLTYDYELSENREASAVRDVCFRATASAFEGVWPHFLSGFLFINSWIEEVVNAYMSYIKMGIKSQVGNWTWMAEGDRSATLEKLGNIQFTRFYGHGMSKEAIQCTSGRQVSDTSFVSNMVRLKYRDVSNCTSLSVSRNEALIRQILLGNELTVDPSRLMVTLPPMYVVPPMYYRQVEDDKFINIAVLGTQFARKVVSLVDRSSSLQATTGATKNATSSWSKGTLANYSAFQDCYNNKSAHLHEKLNGEQFDDAFSVMASMHIAFEGKRDYERDYVKKSTNRMRASNAILYKRACLSLCTARGAAQDANTLDYTTAYAACLFGAANAPSFAETFDCKPEETMSSIGRCYTG
ncbi:hypothetical protein V5799_011210 [Amblyomma americanum]|uniref:Uncharacterized protein n=1 Tax=Amblyomma americanum TaxID=6943 RepID=A0AAQ4EHK6_AMBAM